jgi:hypothetical protein
VIRRARVAFASAFVGPFVVNSCSSASTAVVTTTTVPSAKAVPISSFPVVDLKGVNGQWVADDVHLNSDGSGSVCLGTPMGTACSRGGLPSFAVLQVFWSTSDGSAGPAPRDFASALARTLPVTTPVLPTS